MSLRENSNNDLKKQQKIYENVGKYFFKRYKEGFLNKIYKER